jgi:hypothetical protein
MKSRVSFSLQRTMSHMDAAVIKLYLSCQQLESTLEPKDGIVCTAMFIAHGKASLGAAVKTISQDIAYTEHALVRLA